MDHPLPYPTAEQLQTILTELREDDRRRAQRVREYDQVTQDLSLSEEERRLTLAPFEALSRADEDSLWQAYFTWRGDQADDQQSERYAIHKYLRGGFIAVEPSTPPTLEQLRLVCRLLWIMGEDGMHVLSQGLMVWKYLKGLVEDRTAPTTPEQREAATDLLTALNQRTLPHRGQGPRSDEGARLWVPAIQKYYATALPQMEALFQQHTTVEDRAQALHAAYPAISADTFREWIAPPRLKGNPLPRQHTAIRMARRVTAWRFRMYSTESVRKLLVGAPKPLPPPDWLPTSLLQPWPQLTALVLQGAEMQQWAIQRALGPGEHSLGEDVLTFDTDGIAVTSQWSTVLQALQFPAMFRVKPWLPLTRDDRPEEGPA